MYNRITIIVAALLAIISSASATAPKREFRGSWISTVWALDWPKDDNGNAIQGTSATAQAKQKAALTKMLDTMQDDGFNVAFFQVRPMCDALYKSSYTPWSSYLTGARGADPGWDPLQFAIEEAHKRGIELHAWLNPYRWSSSPSNNWNTPYDVELRNNNMLVTEGNLTCLNPGLQSVIDHIVNVTKEICTNYKVDGIVFDDYFYPNGMPETTDADDYQLYKDSGTTLSLGNWRRDNVNRMVKAVYEAVKESRPEARFGISPAGVAKRGAADAGISQPSVSASDWQYSDIYSDPIAWVHKGIVDYISPQIYWNTNHTTAPFGPLTKWWSETAATFNRHHYASHSISDFSSDNSEANWEEYGTQIDLSRQYTQNNASGCVFFRQAFVSGPLKSGFGAWLKANKFALPAITPEITWRSALEYDAVTNLAQDGSSLSWNDASHGELVRYTIYAVPQTLNLEEAQAADGDGLNHQYLLGVSYDTTFELPADKSEDHWYAVCVFNGLGKEFTPAILGLATETAPIATPISPINDAQAGWYATFSWQAVENGTYEVQISDNANFSKTVLSHKGIVATSTTIDLTSLATSTQYYWRVKCYAPGFLSSVSPAATFRTSTKDDAPVATLISPTDGEAFYDNITFTWEADAAVVGTVQVALDPEFNNIVQESEGSTVGAQCQAEVMVKNIGIGTFYWRVKTSSPIHNNSYTESRQFSVLSLPAGDVENGYIVKKDPSAYTPGRASLTNLWMRSVKSDFANFVQNNDGTMNRGMTIADGVIYVSERETASATSVTLLRKYDLYTGENIGTITLDDNVHARYMPVNDVITDSEGNVCVTNLTVNTATNPLNLSLVDRSTGATTIAASVTTPSKARIDHCAVTGDVATGNFSLYAALSSGKELYRWDYEDGELKNTHSVTLQGYSPASATSLGVAPRVIPMDEKRVMIDGGATAISCYDIETGALISTLPDALTPTTFNANGGDFFSLAGVNYVVYPMSDHSAANGFTYNIVSTNDTFTLASASQIADWTIPANGLGSVNATVMGAVAQHVVLDDNRALVVLYVPGNGMAAYSIDVAAGIENGVQNAFDMSQYGNRISFSRTADEVAVYSLSGTLVNTTRSVDGLYLDVAPGVYILRATSQGTPLSRKIIVK